MPSRAAAGPVLVTALCAAGIVAFAVTFRLTTPDVWQHLLVGKAIWTLGRIPQEHLWTWPSWGREEVLPSWGFRWALWPFWLAGGVWGLAAWRWLTTLAAYACAWLAARRLGARGLTPLVVIAIVALSYRTRAQVRPETLAALLLAAQILVLERRRAIGGGALALIAIAWVWANVHLSYYLGLGLTAVHVLAARPPASDSPPTSFAARADSLPGLAVLGLSVAVSFLNPFGWRALAQPIEYFLVWRNEPVYRSISELAPLLSTWPAYWRSGLPLVVLAWPTLIAVRATRRRFDLAEALTCALFTGLALFNQRFVGFLMIANAPYLARDLSEWTPQRPWAAPWARAAAAIAIMLAASLPSWSDPRYPPGVGFVPTYYPSAACDFIARNQIRGRMFNPYYFGGYVAWRFWPDRSRLPFMDIHQSGTPKDRALYAYAFANPEAWSELQRERDFDVALVDGHQEWVRGDRLLDQLDRDPAWALVFRDDAAAIYLKREGRHLRHVEALGYRVLPGGNEAFVALGPRVARDTTLRRVLRSELDRRVESSPLHASALLDLASLDFLDGDRERAHARLLEALAIEPLLPGAHRRLGYLAMEKERWREAIAEFERERLTGSSVEDEYLRMGQAFERLGDRAQAARAYRRHLAAHMDDAAASEALRRVESGR